MAAVHEVIAGGVRLLKLAWRAGHDRPLRLSAAIHYVFADTFSNAVYRGVYAGRQLAQVNGGHLLGRKSAVRKDLWERRTFGAGAETVHSVRAAVRKSLFAETYIYP